MYSFFDLVPYERNPDLFLYQYTRDKILSFDS
jgi:hypothetical protein